MITLLDPREKMLLDLAHFYGIQVFFTDLSTPGSECDAHIRRRRSILLRGGQTTAQRVSALAHAIIHARRGDDGRQAPDVEERVEEEAAALIITASAYAAAERVVGRDPRALAQALEVTPSLVVAWQRQATLEHPALAS
ncbi:hypothetical protein NSA19_02725 [Actinomyces bowdenii]|uniref:hypothetical protein n=1 Tax=Actinomyces bowdenii TaxID=131109 RepID=UPI00214C40C2|nr:hypothetical protein [Actinomyces bowdenii]MCR2051783.1 hypothetical protein [Actinomyces bowdenii]